MLLECQNQTRHWFITQLALPNTLALISWLWCNLRRRWRHWLWSHVSTAETGDGERSIIVLPNVGNYPIRTEGPSMNPRNRAALVITFDDDGQLKGDDGERNEGKRQVVWGRGAGEQPLQMLVRWWAVEPPL